jgi:RNA recognition motif-containing protein
MSSKLFIGNLDWNTEKDEFQTHFSQYGDIEDLCIITDKETGMYSLRFIILFFKFFWY